MLFLCVAGGSVGAAEAIARRAAGSRAWRHQKKLRSELGCEDVAFAASATLDDVGLLTQLVRAQASELRAALDGPWSGLWVELDGDMRGGGARGEEVRGDGSSVNVPACQILGLVSGGGQLVVRGQRGGASMLPFVREHWRVLRSAQDRYSLMSEVKQRLGGTDVQFTGGQEKFAPQVASLRSLLSMLRTQFVPQPPENALSAVVLHIGDDAYSQGAARGHGHRNVRRRKHPNLDIFLPDRFSPEDALEQYTRAMRASPSGTTSNGRGRSRRRHAGKSIGK